MKKFSYDLNIEALSETEADTKMKAIGILIKKLTAKELARLAEVVQNEPIKTAMAKKALGL